MIEESVFDALVSRASRDGIQQLVVGAIVSDGDRVLLLERPADDFMGGIFELPSGKVEEGETIAAATVREVHEETGLVVTDIGEHVGSFDYLSGSGRASRQLTFVVAVADTDAVVLTEHDAFRWVSLDDEPPVTEEVAAVLAAYRSIS